MKNLEYLKWMSENTKTKWCNDSAMIKDIELALENGAVGCTSNPPLTYEVLTATPEIFKEELKKIDAGSNEDDKAVELIGVVVRHISKMLYSLYETSGKEYGYIRAQVRPDLSADADAMLKMGLKFASWGENIKVKIPGTAAGIWVLEELATRGIPTNPTVCLTVSQITAAAEAYERGRERAKRKGIKPAPSTSAIVMGRLQDFLSRLNEERNAGISLYDLENAALGVAKRCYNIFIEKGYRQILMPAAFRCARQVEQLVGGRLEMTIHPKIQALLSDSDLKGNIKREESIEKPVDKKSIDRVLKAFPEFEHAYEPGALKIEDFDDFGGTAMTLKAFDVTGWQRLKKLETG